MKTLAFVLLISGFSNSVLAQSQDIFVLPIHVQTSVYSTSSDPETDSDEMHTMSVCCPVGNAPSCGWGNFPIGSDCYCKTNGQIFPGTVCSN